mmetsp:Transcript_18052/g.58945  ORF Transcript_18052/g.58945 Transcript_18052/m.58945 type:complete len:205 (+) Transcript_18052:55-669(+)
MAEQGGLEDVPSDWAEDLLSAALTASVLDTTGGEGGDGSACAASEDALHSLSPHRVVHLHRHGRFEQALPGLRAKLLRTVFAADRASRLNLARGRSVNVRCVEFHRYSGSGAGLGDREHRDDGSLLTLVALLRPASVEEGCGGGELVTGAAQAPVPLAGAGDAVVFASHALHNVTPLTGGARAERRSLVVELWEGAPNKHNRHH